MIETSTNAHEVDGLHQPQRGDDDGEREQRLHPEYGPVARLPHPIGHEREHRRRR